MMNARLVIALSTLSLLGVIPSAIAQDKAPTMMKEMAEKVMATPEAAAGETVIMTAQVQSVDLKDRQLTLKDKAGNVFTLDVPPEVRRLAEIKAGDLVVTQYSQALALELSKTTDDGGISVRKSTISVGRAGKDQSPTGVVRENVQVLANIIAIDPASRKVTIKGAVHTVVLKVPENINLDEIKVGDEVLAAYVQELVMKVEPAPPAAVAGWNKKQE
jgi:Cu/Ag efflux protein CusF